MAALGLAPAGWADRRILVAVLLILALAWPAWWLPLRDPDLGWLLWAGDRLRHGIVPRSNGFSWTAPDFPWVSHETLVALSYATVGVDRVGLLRGLVVSATALLVLAACWRRESGLAGLFALAWAVALIAYGRTERALGWGNGMLALVVLLSLGETGHAWRRPLAALLVGVWASIHGSFVIGVLFLLALDWRWGLLAAAASLANPYGLRVWDLVLGYGLGSDVKALVHQAVPEWRSVGPDDPMVLVRAALLIGAGPLLLRRAGWRIGLLWAALTLLALLHRRFFDVAAIALAPFLAEALARRLPPRPVGPALAPAALALALLAAVAPPARLDRQLYPADLPVAELAGIRLWNDFAIGGYLGFLGIPVFWDGRNDCYPVDVFADGLKIEFQAPGWEEAVERRRIAAVLTAHAALAGALAARGWRTTGHYGGLTLLRRPAGT